MSERLRSVSEEDLVRLKAAREEADRLYNAALTELDRAIHGRPDFPHPPPPPDEAQITPLNTRWEILKGRQVVPGGWKGKLATFVWDLIEPALAQQQAFNSALVDHLNRNLPAQREAPKAIASSMALMQEQVERLIHFQSRLIVYLQQMTPYLDSKDYEFAALGRRVTEDAQQDIDRLDRTVRGLAGGLSGVSDEMMKRWESLLARDQRYSGRIDEIRSSLAVAQQQVSALKREFERVAAGDQSSVVGGQSSVVSAQSSVVSGQSSVVGGQAADTTESWKYVGFEDLFRGSRDEIRGRLETYVPLFIGAADVLDVGCGRGEFLDLLTAHGIGARGIDQNHEMVEGCRARGFHADEADALTYLRAQPAESLGGLIAAQVVEHLEPAYLLAFLDQAQRVLRPGSTMVLETINAACWLAFFESYIRDITHARPLHPDTLKYLVTASGFVDAEVRLEAPVAPANQLQPAPKVARQESSAALIALADTFDGNVERLNRLMFTHMDYAVIARRP
ncbi:MAG TPA: class I SAM-dependent methyltransferase [Vicinamibacterales bacterium]|nr:class I SAM-dependent methyltransferase [Vicinamibacterales bacterium]